MYAKLFNSILDSTLWLENHTTRLVFITLMASMDDDGFARFGSPQNLARRAHVTLEEAKEAIETLEGPDKENPDQPHQGRRIEAVEGGYYILNFEKYRDIGTKEDRRKSNRDRKRKQRAAEKNAICHAVSRDVTKCPPSDTDTDSKRERETRERETDPPEPETGFIDEPTDSTQRPFAEAPSKTEVVAFCSNGAGIPPDFAQWWWGIHEHENGWERKDGTPIDWKRAIAHRWTEMKPKWNKHDRTRTSTTGNPAGTQPDHSKPF